MADLFLTVLNMSVTASYVIAAILLVRLFLKKVPKVISYALWAVAALRLALPVSFESLFSLIPFRTQLIPQSTALGEAVSFGSAAGAALRSIGDAANGGLGTVTVYLGKTAEGYPITTEAYHAQVWLLFGSYLWLVGIAVLLIYSVVSVAVLKRRLRGAVLSEGNIYEADNLKTPFVLGILKPKIFVPAGLAAEGKSYIIRHEQTHIRRFDHIMKPFAFLVLSIHWFNPLVWIAFVMMSADMELSCDERVIKEMGGEIKKAYSASLLSLATGKRIINGSPLAFGEGNVGGRIKNILSFKKTTFWMISAAIVLVTLVSIGLMTNPKSDELDAAQGNGGAYTGLNEKDPLTAETTAFETEETDLLEIGRIAFDEYMATLMRDDTPDSDRIAVYQLNDMSMLAGDIEEFCVTLNYDFTTDNDSYVNPGRGAKGKGTWPDNYMEIRVKNIGKYAYEIVSTGTGGGGQGLEQAAYHSNVYTDEEIQAAMECVRKYFSEVATSRILNDLWFDEEACVKNRASYMQYGNGKANGVTAENVIVLLCNFTIENDEAFEGHYPDWQMILIRDSADGAWRVDDQGVYSSNSFYADAHEN